MGDNSTLRVPAEGRFVGALVEAVAPPDALAFLLEIGALSRTDMGVVRILRTTFERLYDQLGQQQRWNLERLAGVLADVLGQADYQAYLAWRLRQGLTADVLVEALAVIGASADVCARPWSRSPLGVFAARWKAGLWQLLALAGTRAALGLSPVSLAARLAVDGVEDVTLGGFDGNGHFTVQRPKLRVLTVQDDVDYCIYCGDERAGDACGRCGEFVCEERSADDQSTGMLLCPGCASDGDVGWEVA